MSQYDKKPPIPEGVLLAWGWLVVASYGVAVGISLVAGAVWLMGAF